MESPWSSVLGTPWAGGGSFLMFIFNLMGAAAIPLGNSPSGEGLPPLTDPGAQRDLSLGLDVSNNLSGVIKAPPCVCKRQKGGLLKGDPFSCWRPRVSFCLVQFEAWRELTSSCRFSAAAAFPHSAG